MRAGRLGIGHEAISLVTDDDVDAIVTLAERERPALLIIDSIQTVGVPEIGSAPGGVAQVRESAARLVRLAKTTGVAVVLVGHVTKEGGLAGPKLLEHMVDVVLYLEGDPDRGFRVLAQHQESLRGHPCVGDVRHEQRGPDRGGRPVQGLSRGLAA